jgi:hypothetical protein
MRRVQWFELEDLGWVPRAVRDGGTDLLDLAFDRLGFYEGVAPRLLSLLSETGATRVVDLGSGGGGGTLSMRARVRAAQPGVEFVLSDLHPNEAGIARVAALGDAGTRYLPEPVDALQGGGALSGVRTMSSALHHFPPEAVKALLGGIVARREPLAFFDVAASPAVRKLPLPLAPVAMLVNMLMLGVASLALVPLLRPVRLSRFALTYLLPLIPLLTAWDGTVSALRAYSPEELLELARSVPGGDTYVWDAGQSRNALYLTGRPRA